MIKTIQEVLDFEQEFSHTLNKTGMGYSRYNIEKNGWYYTALINLAHLFSGQDSDIRILINTDKSKPQHIVISFMDYYSHRFNFWVTINEDFFHLKPYGEYMPIDAEIYHWDRRDKQKIFYTFLAKMFEQTFNSIDQGTKSKIKDVIESKNLTLALELLKSVDYEKDNKRDISAKT